MYTTLPYQKKDEYTLKMFTLIIDKPQTYTNQFNLLIKFHIDLNLLFENNY